MRRTRAATEFFSEMQSLTRDTVPVNVDAVCFWMIWDAQKAVLEVESYYRAISLSTQTALRDIIGTHTLEEMLSKPRVARESPAARARPEDRKSVGIHSSVGGDPRRDHPRELARRDEQAGLRRERERQARIILGTAETEIAAKFVEAARPYQNNPVAVHLRAMNMLYEGLREKGSIIVVPSSAVESMNLGAIGGLAGIAKNGDLSAPPTTST